MSASPVRFCRARGHERNIAAFVITLAPFRTAVLVDSIGSVIERLRISPNTSITVIAISIFLAHQVGLHGIRSFIENNPVLHRFGADLRLFIHHVPTLIPRLSELDRLDFHKALLRSLISSFARESNVHFVNSVLAMLARFPSSYCAI
jgi:hypothetical protein